MNGLTVQAGGLYADSGMLKKARMSGFIGTVIEWYDFFIYGAAAALVFGKLFFPHSNPLLGTMAAFGAFAVGFISRPLGGIIFGHFGDRLGRRAVLVTTLTVMGGSTFLIGALPTYAQVGFWAPFLLVVLRIAQGIALGGEWGGAVLMVVEHAPSDRRGWHSSWPQMGVPIGLLLSTGATGLVSMLPTTEFENWGWRLPFLFSIVLVCVGLLIRLTVSETPIFQKVADAGEILPYPVLEVVRKDLRNVLLTIGSRFAENGSFFIFSVLSVSYTVHYLHVSRLVILGAVSIAALVTIFTIPLFASLTDRVGRRPIFAAGAAFTFVFAFPFFWLLQTGQPALITVALVLAIAGGWAAMYAPQAAYFAELFRPQVRYSGMSIGAQFVAIVAGGPSPLIATAALAATGGQSWPVSVWLISVSVITLLSLLIAPETAGCSLGTSASDPGHLRGEAPAPVVS